MIFPASKNSCSSSVRLGRDSSNSSKESWDELKLFETKNLMATFFLYPTVQLSYWGERVTVLNSRSSTQLPCLFRDKSGRREEWAGSFPLPLGFLYPTTTPSVEISTEGPNFQSSFSKNTRFSFFRQQEYPLFVHDKGKI